MESIPSRLVLKLNDVPQNVCLLNLTIKKWQLYHVLCSSLSPRISIATESLFSMLTIGSMCSFSSIMGESLRLSKLHDSAMVGRNLLMVSPLLSEASLCLGSNWCCWNCLSCPVDPVLDRLVLAVERMGHLNWEGGEAVVSSGVFSDARFAFTFANTRRTLAAKELLSTISGL